MLTTILVTCIILLIVKVVEIWRIRKWKDEQAILNAAATEMVAAGRTMVVSIAKGANRTLGDIKNQVTEVTNVVNQTITTKTDTADLSNQIPTVASKPNDAT